MVDYTCARCGTKYQRKAKLPDEIEPRCEVCRAEIRKAAKRATWHARKEIYTERAKQKKQPVLRENVPSDVENMQAIPIGRPDASRLEEYNSPHLGRPTDIRMMNGRKIVWMGRWLDS